MTEPRICITAVGYNRPDAMLRLLESLGRADYAGDTVDLVISIDKGQRWAEIAALAEDFRWDYGEKTVRAFPERQGLRKHIIRCGDDVLDYDAVIILEDDVTVSKGFYSYAKQAVSFYGEDEKIGGISLYKHCVNVGADHFFEPEFNGFDAFLMQFSQSWGQCWTKRMWLNFRNWYTENSDKLFDSPDFRSDLIPDNILRWGKQSWMKYNMAYIAEKDLYYVYPYHALSTNHSEVGQHNNTASVDWQVETTDALFEYRFPDFNAAVKYDIFFERTGYPACGYEDKKVILDLYGKKKCFEGGEILVSSAKRDYAVLDEWRLKYRPQERNCLIPEKGKGLFVYDLSRPGKNGIKPIGDNLRTRYDVRAVAWNKLIKLGINEFFTKVKTKLKGLFGH